MHKTKISIVLSVVFVLFLVAPTTITIFDMSADTSVFFSLTEEENENNNNVKHIKADITLTDKYSFDIEFGSQKTSSFYLVCQKSSLALQTFSPPPEQQV